MKFVPADPGMKTGGLGQNWVEIRARGDLDFDLKMR
jgi:hypothetical protein